MSKLLSAGEFAKLARTTKRTVLFYDQKEVLKPFLIDRAGYRWYLPRQIIDFQAILLFRKLNFSLGDINNYLLKHISMEAIFELQKEVIKKEISSLEFALKSINSYYHNLEKTHTLVNPKLKKIRGYSVYFIERVGAYAAIKDMCFELKNMFSSIPEDAKYIVIYKKSGYFPKNAHMKIGVIVEDSMRVKEEFKSSIGLEKIPAYKALSYTHYGSGALLSLLWKELDKYFKKGEYEIDPNLRHGQEIYHRTSLNGELNEDKHEFEIQISVR